MRPSPADSRETPPIWAFLADMAALGGPNVAQRGRRHAMIAAWTDPGSWLLPLDTRGVATAGLEVLQPVTRPAKALRIVARGLHSWQTWTEQLGNFVGSVS